MKTTSRTRLYQSERGLSVERRDRPDMFVSLWFYEWNMFDAFVPGQHTPGVWENRVTVSDDGAEATVECDVGLRLFLSAVDDGAEMILEATNSSGYDWPPLASIVPCLNPGLPQPTGQNPAFVNQRTYFRSVAGLSPLFLQAPREIHYNAGLRKLIDAEPDVGSFAWEKKWPMSDLDATAGLILRVSSDGRWVTGIAWDRFLACQGHNPCDCMHLSVNLGPLRDGGSRTVQGKIYLFEGTVEDLPPPHRELVGAHRGEATADAAGDGALA